MSKNKNNKLKIFYIYKPERFRSEVALFNLENN